MVTTAQTFSKETQSAIDEVTEKDIMKAIQLLEPYKYPKMPEYKPSIFEKLMNKLGWYRQTTVYMVDSQQFKPKFVNMPL